MFRESVNVKSERQIELVQLCIFKDELGNSSMENKTSIKGQLGLFQMN